MSMLAASVVCIAEDCPNRISQKHSLSLFISKYMHKQVPGTKTMIMRRPSASRGGAFHFCRVTGDFVAFNSLKQLLAEKLSEGGHTRIVLFNPYVSSFKTQLRSNSVVILWF
ncbi:unnamed protein product [Discosporangium mesarthrocarpum]